MVAECNLKGVAWERAFPAKATMQTHCYRGASPLPRDMPLYAWCAS